MSSANDFDIDGWMSSFEGIDTDFSEEELTSPASTSNRAPMGPPITTKNTRTDPSTVPASKLASNLDSIPMEESELEALVEARSDSPDATYGDLVNEHLDKNAPAVAQNMIRLALHAKTEGTKFAASKYVLDRVLDRATTGPTKLTSLIDDITDYVREATGAE